MSSRVKHKYLIVFQGYTGKQEQMEVEADTILMIDGIEDTLMCWNRRNKVVFALPFSRLIHTQQGNATKLEAVQGPSKPRLKSLQ